MYQVIHKINGVIHPGTNVYDSDHMTPDFLDTLLKWCHELNQASQVHVGADRQTYSWVRVWFKPTKYVKQINGLTTDDMIDDMSIMSISD